ncbi:WXG100 family type VII secretion target [Nocardia sp. NPDC058705]|uniref:WXG100 family type VII secretion target n=1 Tax=Nocardia sp. NPDC058705 TaxID=3346609 RepID=UPI0036CE938B
MSTLGTTEQEPVTVAEPGTLTVAQVMAWAPTILTALGDTWSSQAQKLTTFDDAQYRAVDASRDFWTGSAADAMRARHDEMRTTTRTFVTALQDGATAAQSGAGTLDAARSAVANAVKSAESNGYEVGDDGAVKISTSTHQMLLSQLPDAASYSVAAGALQVGADASTTAVKTALENARTAAASVQTAIENAFAKLPENLDTGVVFQVPGLPQPPGGWSSDPARRLAQEIAYGHAWTKHNDDFKGMTQDQLAEKVYQIIAGPQTERLGKDYKGDPVMMSYDGYIVIVDPSTTDHGTVYRPKAPLDEFIRLTGQAQDPSLGDGQDGTRTGSQRPGGTGGTGGTQSGKTGAK